MRRRIALLGTVPVLLATAVALAPSSSARLVAAEPAGAVTTIAFAHSGTAELVLYDDAFLSPSSDHNPDVRFSGRGRLLAFELSRSDGTGDFLNGARLPSYAGGGTVVGGSTTPKATCSSWPNATVPVQEHCSYHPKRITLHEGYYHLVVLADGSPVTITLRLHGEQQRHAGIRLQTSVRSLETTLPERESMGSSTVTYGAEVAFPSATQAFILAGAKLHRDATVVAANMCARNDSGTPPPYAFSPACAGGSYSGDAYRINGPSGPEQAVVFVSTPSTPLSPDGLGGSFVDSDGPTYLGGLGVWIAGATLTYFGGFSQISG
jgi:hypothetical protein